MALTHTTAVRNGLADYISTQVNAGTPPGKLKIYKTSIDNPTDTNLLVALLFSTSSFAAASGGVITANAIATVNATAAGTAAFFIFTNAANTEILRGTVTATGGGGDITITNTNIAVNDPISVTSLTWTAPT
jgi:hypothetical protein